MPDDVYAKMEAARGRESKSSFVNFIIIKYFAEKKESETNE